jgi:hypothetical protein
VDDRILNEIYNGWLKTLEWAEVVDTDDGCELYCCEVPYKVDKESEARMRAAIRQWCDALPPAFDVECCIFLRPVDLYSIGNRLYLTVQGYTDAFMEDAHLYREFESVYSDAARKMRRFEIYIAQQDDGTYVIYAE